MTEQQRYYLVCFSEILSIPCPVFLKRNYSYIILRPQPFSYILFLLQNHGFGRHWKEALKSQNINLKFRSALLAQMSKKIKDSPPYKIV